MLYDNKLFHKEKNILSFLTQLLNIFQPLKDSKNLLCSKFLLQSLNPSRNFLKCFIMFTPYLIFSDFCILFSITFSFIIIVIIIIYSQALKNFGAW